MIALLTGRAFLVGIVAALGIGVLALLASQTVDLSARDTYKTTSVRL
jgi:hypothetical protein